MTTTLRARVKRWAAETAPDRWTAVAWARDTDAETGLPINRHHRFSDAPTHPEAMQAAHAMLRELHEELIGPVYESRSSRLRTCPTCQHDAPALGHDTAAPRCMYHRPADDNGKCGGCRDLGPHRNVPGCEYYDGTPCPLCVDSLTGPTLRCSTCGHIAERHVSVHPHPSMPDRGCTAFKLDPHATEATA